MKNLFLILSLLILCITSNAQGNYPIYVTPTLTPPYSLKLSDYGAVGSQKLMVSVMVNDLNIVDLPVKLRIKMETAGVTIENPPTITTTPIYLNGGVSTLLFGEDLEDYFKLNNLTFKGYGKDAYRKSGQLPGGFYRFTVEVLHFNTNRLISNSGTASAWIVLGKPPVLMAPLNNAEAGQFVGMPVSFSWQASNVGSPGAVGNIQYLFEMWEMRVDGIDPNTVVASMPVFHDYTTFERLYPLYPSTLLMEPGMKYAWRVTASDVTGMVPFEQDGHSEVRTFVYKAKCDSVNGLCAEAKGKNGFFSWIPDEYHTSFNVEVQQHETGWLLNSETYDTKASYYDLEPGLIYQIRVQGVCNGDPQQVSDYSEWHSLTIPETKPLVDEQECPDCACDDDIPDVELSNFELKTVQPGDTIINKSGTTRFIVRSVNEQGDKTYKGVFLFWAEVWGLKIICNYENLQVNTDNVIVNMDFESVYDPKFMVDVDAISDHVNNLQDDVAQITAGTELEDTITYNGSFDQVIVRNDSVIAVSVAPDGTINEDYIDQADNLDKVLITDKEGDQVVISGNGQAMGVEEFKATGGNSRLLNNYNEEKEAKVPDNSSMVSFSPSDKQQYGFDAYSDLKQAIQHQYPALSNGYRPAYKSLPAFGTDKVRASTTDGIEFRDEMGIKAMGSGQELIIRGSAAGSEVPLYAYRMPTDSTEQVVGKLQMLSYAPQSKKLYIVSVNGANMPDASSLQTTLNTIYAQALTTWQVQLLDPLSNLSFANGNFSHGGSSAFTTYNADQQTVLSAFEQSGRSFEDNAFYLFFIDHVQNKERSIAGYMPLQRQAGFIYDKPDINTIAHELGHGAFNLCHTFSENGFIAAEGSTSNLMDYNGGTELWKYQWDLIHEPRSILFAFLQDEEEGAMEVEKVAKRDDYIKDENGYATFVSPAGMPITIKPTGKVDIIASTEEYNYQVSDNENTFISTGLSIGILLAFEEEGKHYTAAFGADKEFLGYKDVEGEQYKYDNITKTYRESYFVNFIDAQEKFYCFESKFIISEDWKDNEYKAAGSITYPFDPDVFKTIVGDLSAEDYNKLVDELAERLNTQSSQSKYFSVGESFKTGRDEEFNIEDLNDRFKVFNTETGNKVFVDVVYTKDKPSSEQLSTLAEDAYKKSNLVTSSNVIYMVLPVWNETVITNYLKSIDKSKFSKSFYSKNETYNKIPDLLEYKRASGNILEVVESVYMLVPKPHIIIPYAITYNGEIIRFKIQETDNVAGNSFIYDFRLAVDNLLSSFVQQVNIIESNQPKTPPSGYGIGYTTEYQNQAILGAMEAKERIDDYRASGNNIEYKTIKHRLFESALTPNSEGVSEIAQQFTEWYLRHEFGWSASSPDDKYFKIGKNEVVYQETLNSIDKLGVLLMPVGLDVFADGIGAIYAGYYYDIETASYYVGGVVAVGVSGAIFRQLVTRGKRIARVSGEFRIIDNLARLANGSLSKTNLLKVAWKNNIVGHLSGNDALKLWNNTSKEFAHLVDGDFYMKFDKQTGDLLFGNHNTGELLGFYEGVSNVEIINRKELSGILGKLKIYHGVSGSPSYIVTSNLSSGARIISNPEKTTTIIGNYMRYEGYSGDMKAIVGDELLGDLKTQQFGAKKGGFNVLNISDETIAANGSWAKFWDNFNKPWLEAAIQRGDDIWATSDPMDLSLLFSKPLNSIQNMPTHVTPSNLSYFLKGYEELDDLSGFGKEVKLLFDNGYSYNSTIKKFVK